MFTTEIGTPKGRRNISRRWHRVPQRLDRPDLRFHDLRHGCATIWLAGGEHPKMVQDLFGHHTITMTTDLYGHVVPATHATHREAAARIGKLLGAASQLG